MMEIGRGRGGCRTDLVLQRDYPELKILVLSQFTDMEHIRPILRTGVHGYVSKKSGIEELQQAILRIDKQGFYFDKELEAMIRDIKDMLSDEGGISEPVHISERERDVILLTAKGMGAKEIGDILNISARTVEVHKKNLMARTGSAKFLNVILHAVAHGTISLHEVNDG